MKRILVRVFLAVLCLFGALQLRFYDDRRLERIHDLTVQMNTTADPQEQLFLKGLIYYLHTDTLPPWVHYLQMILMMISGAAAYSAFSLATRKQHLPPWLS